jgi:hypothetical protein
MSAQVEGSGAGMVERIRAPTVRPCRIVASHRAAEEAAGGPISRVEQNSGSSSLRKDVDNQITLKRIAIKGADKGKRRTPEIGEFLDCQLTGIDDVKRT